MGRVVLVTGAGGGIGRATVERFAAAEYSVVATDLDEAAVAETLELARAHGVEAQGIRHDVCSSEQWDEAVAAATESFGRLDVLVNNAGIEGVVAPFTEQDPDDIRRVFEVNVLGTVRGIAAAAPAMTGGGAVVNVASVAGLGGAPGIGPYVASKHAVIGVTRTAALELAGQGIRVTAVCPAPIETRMMRSLEAGMSPEDPAAVHDAIASANPLGRYGTPAEVASAIVWLASDEASYVNGTILTLDGGGRAR